MSEAARTSHLPGPTPGPRWPRRLAITAVASLLLHLGGFAYVRWMATTPDVGIEFQLPVEVEFGMTDEVEPVAAAATPDEPTPSEPNGAQAANGAAQVDGGTPEPQKPEPEKNEPTPERAALAAAKAAAESRTGAPGDTFGSAALPPGAQLALRMNMARIRRSSLAPKVRQLLATIPDWQALLGDSGLEPVDDLERVLIASPNLRRDRVVIAGRYTGDPSLPRDIVARMAAARGEAAPWSTKDGVPVAPWPDRDVTPRVIALIGQHQFSISRPEDLSRVLAVAQARQARRHGKNGKQGEETPAPSPEPEAWGEALLSMGDHEALSLEVEGAQHFVRGAMASRFPVRLRLAAGDLPNGRVRLTAEGTYASPADAQAALEYAERVREAYAHNLAVRLMGVSSALEGAELKVEGDTLNVETELTQAQVALLLGYVQGLLSQNRPAPGTTPVNPTPPEEPDTGELGETPPTNPYR